MKGEDFLILAVAGIAVVMLYVAGAKIERQRWEEDAVKHDKAEFYLDANNDRQWRWKP